MTIRELRKIMKGKPWYMDVVMEQTQNDDFTITMVESAKVKTVEFREDSGPLKAKVKCLVLSDDI